jgi:hypothetical protein
MHRCSSSCHSDQLHLFHPVPKVPAWNVLPEDVRHKAANLLARMLREHFARVPCANLRRGMPHE